MRGHRYGRVAPLLRFVVEANVVRNKCVAFDQEDILLDLLPLHHESMFPERREPPSMDTLGSGLGHQPPQLSGDDPWLSVAAGNRLLLCINNDIY